MKLQCFWLLFCFLCAAIARHLDMTAQGVDGDGEDGPPDGKKSELHISDNSFNTDDTESEMWEKELELMESNDGDDPPEDPELMENNEVDLLEKELELMDQKEEDGDDGSQGDDEEEAYIQLQDAKAEIQWNNKYHKAFSRSCGSYGGINYVYSVFGSSYSDRRWSWGCRKVTSDRYRYCHWSGNENAWRGNMNFTCPTNPVLNGVYSYYVGAANDRLWRFLCCETPRRYTSNCYFTQLTNTGQEPIWHNVGAPRVFSGAYSLYNHKKKDRLWKYRICEYGTSSKGRAAHRLITD